MHPVPFWLSSSCALPGPVYATTAANSHESSYACYYDEKRGTYLGDLYSVNWMEDSDAVGRKSSAQASPQGANFSPHHLPFANFAPAGGPDQRDTAETVQDCEEPHQRQPRAAVWKQGDGNCPQRLGALSTSPPSFNGRPEFLCFCLRRPFLTWRCPSSRLLLKPTACPLLPSASSQSPTWTWHPARTFLWPSWRGRWWPPTTSERPGSCWRRSAATSRSGTEHDGLSTGRRAAGNESVCVSVRLQVREILDTTMRRVVQTVTGNAPQTERVLNGRADLTQYECYSTVLRHYRRICFNWHQPEVQTPRAPQATRPPPLARSHGGSLSHTCPAGISPLGGSFNHISAGGWGTGPTVQLGLYRGFYRLKKRKRLMRLS